MISNGPRKEIWSALEEYASNAIQCNAVALLVDSCALHVLHEYAFEWTMEGQKKRVEEQVMMRTKFKILSGFLPESRGLLGHLSVMSRRFLGKERLRGKVGCYRMLNVENQVRSCSDTLKCDLINLAAFCLCNRTGGLTYAVAFQMQVDDKRLTNVECLAR